MCKSLQKKVAVILHRDYTFVAFIIIILKVFNLFEKEYKDKFVASRLMVNVKDMMSSYVLTGISVQSYY